VPGFTRLAATIESLSEEDLRKKLGGNNAIGQLGDDIERQIIGKIIRGITVKVG
jgi:hypothetical protein